ncbi:MAG: DUF4442 domain-containing protein [Desulfobulbaceae bacterium]|nr:MAG: DUF4442 domain-containing protein [Desulfobulbaceae bacterium]
MNGFNLLSPLATKATYSPFWLRVLNILLGRVIPFNRPHGFRLAHIEPNKIRTTAPYRRKNHNHIRGIHACAIATVAEFSAGFLLLTTLDPQRFRLIMSKLEIDYLYQAKAQVYSESAVEQKILDQKVVEPLNHQESVSITIKSQVTDVSGNTVAVAHTTWQIKRWDRVRTAL